MERERRNDVWDGKETVKKDGKEVEGREGNKGVKMWSVTGGSKEGLEKQK